MQIVKIAQSPPAPASAPATAKIQATKIEFGFSESPAHHRLTVFEGPNVWERASRYARHLAQYSPESIGCYKTDFKVTFADGNEYQGRLDIKSTGPGTYGGNDTDVAAHVRQFCTFYGNRHKPETLPSHITPEQYQSILGRYTNGETDYYADMLDRYQIG